MGLGAPVLPLPNFKFPQLRFEISTFWIKNPQFAKMGFSTKFLLFFHQSRTHEDLLNEHFHMNLEIMVPK